MGRLGSPRAQAATPAPQPQPSAPVPADDEREPESNGEELYLCLVEALKDLPMRTKIAAGRAMLTGPRYTQLADDVREAYEAAAELVWSDDEDDDEDEGEESEG